MRIVGQWREWKVELGDFLPIKRNKELGQEQVMSIF